MARNIQLRSTSSFTKICQKYARLMMMMFSKSCLSESIFGLFNCNACWWCMDYVSSHFHLRRRMCVLIYGHEREVWRKQFWDKVQRETISLEWGLVRSCHEYCDLLNMFMFEFWRRANWDWTNFPILVAISGISACYVMCSVKWDGFARYFSWEDKKHNCKLWIWS